MADGDVERREVVVKSTLSTGAVRGSRPKGTNFLLSGRGEVVKSTSLVEGKGTSCRGRHFSERQTDDKSLEGGEASGSVMRVDVEDEGDDVRDDVLEAVVDEEEDVEVESCRAGDNDLLRGPAACTK